jgi:hypothetical protein
MDSGVIDTLRGIQCEALTKKGVQCSRQAQRYDSEHGALCQQHYAATKKASPKTRRSHGRY